MSWWRCPNTPPCGHAGVFHDVEDFDDPLATCCIEGCPCGHDREKRRRLLAELTAEAIEAGSYDEPAPEMRPEDTREEPGDCSFCEMHRAIRRLDGRWVGPKECPLCGAQSNAAARSSVSAGTEVDGGAGEAQEARE